MRSIPALNGVASWGAFRRLREACLNITIAAMSAATATTGSDTQLRSGIPLISEVEALQSTDLYRRYTRYNSDFLQTHGPALQGYGKHWGMDPFKLWSRRWEYPFVAQRVIEFGQGRETMKLLDAGSGVTFFPYLVCDSLASAECACVDYDDSYPPMFEAINRNRGEAERPRVTFMKAFLQKLPLESDSLDSIACISVLEHTDNYGDIVNEFARVLKPGGQFVLTFDLSLDGKFTLPREQAQQLLSMIEAKFSPRGDVHLGEQLTHIHDAGVLTTDYVKKTQPELLPWSTAAKVYKTVQDFVQGKGFTGGFRSRTVFCLDVLKKS